jgi:hypothetical protein
MDPRTILNRSVSTGLRLGRGTADRVVTLAGPPLGRLTDRMASKVRRQDRPTTTTFTPSKKAEQEPAEEPTSQKPSPATVARNIGPQRPSAKPPRPSKPRSVPGAKLPPPRPSTT